MCINLQAPQLKETDENRIASLNIPTGNWFTCFWYVIILYYHCKFFKRHLKNTVRYMYRGDLHIYAHFFLFLFRFQSFRKRRMGSLVKLRADLRTCGNWVIASFSDVSFAL